LLRLFEDTAERVGLARIKTVGERFDPAVHEALQQLDTNEHPPGTIVNEIAAGYRFGERLVRPARVIVARKPAEPAKAVAASAAEAPEPAPEPAPTAATAAPTDPAPSEPARKSSKPPAGEGSSSGGTTSA
jgi:molecular chaperone GrpE